MSRGAAEARPGDAAAGTAALGASSDRRVVRRALLDERLPAAAGPSAAAAPGGARLAADDGFSFQFRWNSRRCTGNRLHKAALEGDLAEASRILDRDREAVHRRFSYETEYSGQVQEGSGEAIHLAVTRSSFEMVQLLLQRGAQLSAMVTRAGKGHYDVFHAAVFAEGIGGTPAMVRFLLSLKATATENLDGRYPLHMAYQAGAKELIPLLQQDMQQHGLLELVTNVDADKKSPLQVGIEAGKLTQEELAQVALLTPMSLKVFLRFEPRSIPAFCERWAGVSKGSFRGSALAEHVTVADLCHCLRNHPQAAIILLDKLTDTPEVDNPGWHPLPLSMDFGPQGMLEVLRDAFNQRSMLVGTYQLSNRWEFDAINFRPPRWHTEVIRAKHGPETHDVRIRVCHLPDILCADVLAALLVTDERIFGSDFVRAMLNVVWWGGAYKVDVLNLLFTLIAIVLLIVERAQFDYHQQVDFGHGADVDRGTVGARTFQPQVVDEYVGARGFVDLANELLELAGFLAMGQVRHYFNQHNLYHLFRGTLSVIFYCTSDFRTIIQVFLVLIYWFRLLEVTCCEKLMRELLPLTRLAKGLMPSCVLCLIGTAAITHARWLMHTRGRLWPDIFRDTFVLMLTAEVPDPEECSTFALVFAFLSVMAFNIFFLNIFIGVIGDVYAREKERSDIAYRVKKCSLCFAFLVRTHVLPGRVMSSLCALGTMVLATAGVVLALLVRPPDSSLLTGSHARVTWLAACQMMAIWAGHQDTKRLWTASTSASGEEPAKRYMWVCSVCHPVVETQEARIARALRVLEGKVEELQALVAEREPGGDPAVSEAPVGGVAAYVKNRLNCGCDLSVRQLFEQWLAHKAAQDGVAPGNARL